MIIQETLSQMKKTFNQVFSLLNFRQYIKYKIALCLFADMNFDKTLLDSRNEQYEHLQLRENNGICVL